MHESRCRWVSFSFFLLASAKWLKDTLRPDPQFCTWNFPSSRRRRRDKSPRKGYALHTPSVKLTWTRGHFYFLHSLSLSLSHSLSPQSSQHMRVTDYLRSSVHRETVEEIILSFPPLPHAQARAGLPLEDGPLHSALSLPQAGAAVTSRSTGAGINTFPLPMSSTIQCQCFEQLSDICSFSWGVKSCYKFLFYKKIQLQGT